jgi:hypothetical protein
MMREDHILIVFAVIGVIVTIGVVSLAGIVQ